MNCYRTIRSPDRWLPRRYGTFLRTLCCVFAVCIFILNAASSFAESPTSNSTESIRHIVSKSLAAIQRGGDAWIHDNDCLSCHRVSFQVWALNRAAELGLEVDLDKVQQSNQWATTWQNLVNPDRRDQASEQETLRNESDTLAQLLLGRRKASKQTSSKQTSSKQAQSTQETSEEWVEVYGDNLLAAQTEKGFWNAGGQLPLQKRPKRETTEVTTMWCLLGLQASLVPREDLEPALIRARKWLSESTRGESTEWWATRLMVERQLGQAAEADRFRSQLLEFQNADGGWGWLVADESDALGTGIALYALARDGLTVDELPVQSAIAFLQKSQADDGSWDVHGTKMNSRDSIEETASYWGTAWAAIGMKEFLVSPPTVPSR